MEAHGGAREISMKGIERLIEICLETWPDEPIGLRIWPSMTGGYSFQVEISRWLTPPVFSESDLAQPREIIRTLKSSMDAWVSLEVKQ